MVLYIVPPVMISLGLSMILGRFLIPFLKSKNLGQKILEIGPRWHKSKEGTPLMGGFLFIFGSLAVVLAFISKINPMIIYTFIMALCYGLIGFFDDYLKMIKKQNEGLSEAAKLALQFPVAIVYVVLLRYSGVITTELFIPFAGLNLDLGVFYYVFLVLGTVYIVNCVNFADGVDGLCGSVTAVVMIMFIILFYMAENIQGLVLISACFGSIIGFLYYNFYPAKLFMGDTGSQFLGGMVVGGAVWLDMPLLFFLFGIVYIMEGLSVIIQVTGFKLTGKRVFKMAPVHHHFELCGWSEVKIVTVASVITVFGAAASVIAKIIE